MKEREKKIIDIMSVEQNWKAICIVVAKNNPMAFLKAAELCSKDGKYVVIKRESGKIAAIRAHRNDTGASLKDSKEYIETLSS